MSAEARSNIVHIQTEKPEETIHPEHPTKTPREHMDELSRDGKYWEILTSSLLTGISKFDRETRVARIIAERLRDLNEERQRISGGMGFAQHVGNRAISPIDKGRYASVLIEIERLRTDYLRIFPPEDN